MTDLKTTVKLNYMKKVTIETVARKVGVSAATVSYALSGKRKISPEVKEKILQAMKELDYRPSITARNLASKKTWTVGFFASPTQNIRTILALAASLLILAI